MARRGCKAWKIRPTSAWVVWFCSRRVTSNEDWRISTGLLRQQSTIGSHELASLHCLPSHPQSRILLLKAMLDLTCSQLCAKQLIGEPINLVPADCIEWGINHKGCGSLEAWPRQESYRCNIRGGFGKRTRLNWANSLMKHHITAPSKVYESLKRHSVTYTTAFESRSKVLLALCPVTWISLDSFSKLTAKLDQVQTYINHMPQEKVLNQKVSLLSHAPEVMSLFWVNTWVHKPDAVPLQPERDWSRGIVVEGWIWVDLHSTLVVDELICLVVGKLMSNDLVACIICRKLWDMIPGCLIPSQELQMSTILWNPSTLNWSRGKIGNPNRPQYISEQNYMRD